MDRNRLVTMSTRHTGRRPNRRQVPTAILAQSLTPLQVHGEVIDGSETVIQVDVLATSPVIPDLGDVPAANSILLQGVIDGTFATAGCIEVVNGGPTGLGQGMTLRFPGVLDLTLGWQVCIPATLFAVQSRFRGDVSGTLQSDEINSGVPGGYLRLTNLGVVGTALPALMWVLTAAFVDGTHLQVQTDSAGNSPFAFTGVPALTDSAAGAATAIADDTSGFFTLTFAGGCVPGSTLSGPAWDPAIRGQGGEWLAPFASVVLP